jgi:hypothetical protein
MPLRSIFRAAAQSEGQRKKRIDRSIGPPLYSFEEAATGGPKQVSRAQLIHGRRTGEVGS